MTEENPIKSENTKKYLFLVKRIDVFEVIVEVDQKETSRSAQSDIELYPDGFLTKDCLKSSNLQISLTKRIFEG